MQYVVTDVKDRAVTIKASTDPPQPAGVEAPAGKTVVVDGWEIQVGEPVYFYGQRPGFWLRAWYWLLGLVKR